MTRLTPDAYHEVFSVIGARDGVHPVYHSKYLEWETSVWVANMDLLWTGEERDASVAVQRAHDQTNALLGRLNRAQPGKNLHS